MAACPCPVAAPVAEFHDGHVLSWSVLLWSVLSGMSACGRVRVVSPARDRQCSYWRCAGKADRAESIAVRGLRCAQVRCVVPSYCTRMTLSPRCT